MDDSNIHTHQNDNTTPNCSNMNIVLLSIFAIVSLVLARLYFQTGELPSAVVFAELLGDLARMRVAEGLPSWVPQTLQVPRPELCHKVSI
eukprot:4658091-Amphidinium_carterae.1